MPGIYVGVLLVAAIRYFQTRKRALLIMITLFALLAVAKLDGLPYPLPGLFHLGAGFAGCLLVFVLAPFPPPHPR